MTKQTLPSSSAGRIALLLDHSDATEADLANLLSLPTGIAVRDVLSGMYGLSPSQLVAVADLLDVPVTVLTGQVPIDRHLGVSLRLGAVEAADVPAVALEYADKLLRYRALLDSWLGSRQSPLAGINVSTDGYYMRAGKETAQRVRDGLGLGEEPITDLVELVERLGFPVGFQPLPADVHGLTARDEREGAPSRAIIVSTCGPWTMQRFTLAHEMCHALYDDEGQVIVDRVDVPEVLPELRAESFARYLLLPVQALAVEVRQGRKAGMSWDVLTARLMIRWGVSRLAVLRAIVSDGLADEADLASVRDSLIDDLMAKAGLTEQWRDLSAGQKEASGSPWLVDRAVEAYGNGLVGVHVVAELLGQDAETTERQLADEGWTAPPPKS
jgi:Zn-dependent peptidase ImmA (M78 family)